MKVSSVRNGLRISVRLKQNIFCVRGTIRLEDKFINRFVKFKYLDSVMQRDVATMIWCE